MPGPVEPNYNGSSSGVASWRVVQIMDINEELKVAHCQDTHRGTMSITTRYYTGRKPAVGERWIVERKYGMWLFTYYAEPDSN